MPEWIATPLGELRQPMPFNEPDMWMLRVPGCGKVERLSRDQFHGRLSVNHGAVCECGYHETHNYAAALASVSSGTGTTECTCGPDEYCSSETCHGATVEPPDPQAVAAMRALFADGHLRRVPGANTTESER